MNRPYLWAILAAFCLAGCSDGAQADNATKEVGAAKVILTAQPASERSKSNPPEFAEAAYQPARQAMVATQIAARGVNDARVLEAMRRVPRHELVPARLESKAYRDRPLPIGHGQTISQPYIVGYMTELLELEPGDRVLEVGTGSGYQAAILGQLVDHVVTIEIIDELAHAAAADLQSLGYTNITVLEGDGYFGYPPQAPFDAIIVTAAADHIPPPLIDQLKPGARMAVPVGRTGWTQNLMLVSKDQQGTVTTRNLMAVSFVPLTRRD